MVENNDSEMDYEDRREAYFERQEEKRRIEKAAYVANAIEDINNEFLSSGYEAFGAFIEEEILIAQKNNDSDRIAFLEEAWRVYFEKSKQEYEAETIEEDGVIAGKDTTIESSEELIDYEEDEKDYIESVYIDYYSEFLSSNYESFDEYIRSEISNLESWETSRKDKLLDVLHYYEELESKKQEVVTEKEVADSVSLEDMSVEELIALATENQGTIAANDKEIKDALIKRILSQQQQISEQEEEINRLKGQKVK